MTPWVCLQDFLSFTVLRITCSQALSDLAGQGRTWGVCIGTECGALFVEDLPEGVGASVL